MPVNSTPVRPSADGHFRRFLTRAEAVTLIGMPLTVFSLFLPWEHYSVSGSGVTSLPAMYTNLTDVTRTGFTMPIRWPIMVCAILCGTALLFAPTEKMRVPIAILQGICGLTCFIIAVTKFALLSGVLLGLVGSALLTFGAVDRFTLPPERPPDTGPAPPSK